MGGRVTRAAWRTPRSGAVAVSISASTPVVLRAMEALTGRPDMGRVLLDLLCEADERGVVRVEAERARAFCAGFGGQRATVTWRERISALEAVGAAEVRRVADGGVVEVALLDPYETLSRGRASLPRDLWNGLVEVVSTNEDDASVRRLVGAA